MNEEAIKSFKEWPRFYKVAVIVCGIYLALDVTHRLFF